MSKLLKIACSQLGVKEITGSKHNKTIVDYAHDIGLKWINDDETPWCAIFVNWCLKQAGLPYLKSALARDGLKVGVPVQINEVRPGDIVVFWRGSREGIKGHEAIVLGFDFYENAVYCVGGNQGNEVSVALYDLDHLLGFRRLENIQTKDVPKAPLSYGDDNVYVETLQNLLNAMGYKVGKADGLYGTKTKKAVEAFQTDCGFPPGDITGEFNDFTRDHMISKLQE